MYSESANRYDGASGANNSVAPLGRYPTKEATGDRYSADGRERHVGGHQPLAGRRQLPQKGDPNAGCLLGVVFEAIVPLGGIDSATRVFSHLSRNRASTTRPMVLRNRLGNTDPLMQKEELSSREMVRPKNSEV